MIKAEWTNADALNLQPTCNQLATDCISRQAAIDVVKGIDSYFVKYIEELPSAQPERKTGRWIHERLASTNGGTYAVVRCSICKSQFPMWETNYCPNCGAKMEVEHEAD